MGCHMCMPLFLGMQIFPQISWVPWHRSFKSTCTTYIHYQQIQFSALNNVCYLSINGTLSGSLILLQPRSSFEVQYSSHPGNRLLKHVKAGARNGCRVKVWDVVRTGGILWEPLIKFISQVNQYPVWSNCKPPFWCYLQLNRDTLGVGGGGGQHLFGVIFFSSLTKGQLNCYCIDYLFFVQKYIHCITF